MAVTRMPDTSNSYRWKSHLASKISIYGHLWWSVWPMMTRMQRKAGPALVLNWGNTLNCLAFSPTHHLPNSPISSPVVSQTRDSVFRRWTLQNHTVVVSKANSEGNKLCSDCSCKPSWKEEDFGWHTHPSPGLTSVSSDWPLRDTLALPENFPKKCCHLEVHFQSYLQLAAFDPGQVIKSACTLAGGIKSL